MDMGKDSQRLTDLDFTEDIALLGKSQEDVQNLTNRVEKEAGHIGLMINSAKTKVMIVGQCDDGAGIWVGGRRLEETDSFATWVA